MPLLVPTLIVLLGATPAVEDVPALLKARTAQLLDARRSTPATGSAGLTVAATRSATSPLSSAVKRTG
jgi:hypothetical protein